MLLWYKKVWVHWASQGIVIERALVIRCCVACCCAGVHADTHTVWRALQQTQVKQCRVGRQQQAAAATATL
jgi:hypothetical protein